MTQATRFAYAPFGDGDAHHASNAGIRCLGI
jgi:hypothetical protein